MSNIGKQRILVPKNLKIQSFGWKLSASGKYGSASIKFPPQILLRLKENYIYLYGPKIEPALYGSLQRKLKAIIHGLSLEYVSYLQFVGVGYRARIEDNTIIIRLGFSHEISLSIPEDLKVKLVKKNTLKIAGSNYEKLRQFAYKLRSFRPPEPFKGKGIVCLGEIVRRKEGKKKKI